MMKHNIQTTIEINATGSEVYRILTDLPTYPEWNPFIVHSEGRAVKGETLRNTMRNGEKTMVFKPKVLQADEGRTFEWLGSLWFKGLFDGHHYFRIEQVDERKVRLVHGENFSGILAGAILKKIGAQTQANFEAMNRALKDRAENGNTR